MNHNHGCIEVTINVMPSLWILVYLNQVHTTHKETVYSAKIFQSGIYEQAPDMGKHNLVEMNADPKYK